ARDRRNKIRRSHILLAGAVVAAGVAALLGNRSTTPAEVRGAPLDGAGANSAGANAPGAPTASMPASAASAAVAAAPAPPIPDLIALDRRTLAADGAHFEAPLKDGRRAVLTLDPKLQALAEKLLSEARAPRGAIVAMAPDGRILALAGRRSDPPVSGAKDKTARHPTLDWRPPTHPRAPPASP